MEPCELLRVRVAVNVELADLFGIGQDGLEFAQEDLCADLLIEVADADGEFFRLALVDGLEEDLWSNTGQCRRSGPV